MMSGPDSAVVFFSRDGNTKRGAEILCARIGGKLIELKERRPGNYLHALLRMKTPLDGDPWAGIASAKRVYLMCPVWAFGSVPAMNAFADKADFTDKDVYIVTFQQSVNHKPSYREHQHLAGIVARNHGSVRECYALTGAKKGQFAGEEHIRAQIDTIKLPETAAEAPGIAPAEAPTEVPAAEAPVPVPERAPESTPPEDTYEVPEGRLSAKEAFDEKTPAREAPPKP